MTKPKIKSNPLPLQFGWGAVGKSYPLKSCEILRLPQGFPSCKPHAFWGKESLGAFPGTSGWFPFRCSVHTQWTLSQAQQAKEVLGWAKELFRAWVMVEVSLPEHRVPSQGCEITLCLEISPLLWLTALLSWLLESLFLVLVLLQQHLGEICLNPQHAYVSVHHSLNLGKEKATVH